MAMSPALMEGGVDDPQGLYQQVAHQRPPSLSPIILGIPPPPVDQYDAGHFYHAESPCPDLDLLCTNDPLLDYAGSTEPGEENRLEPLNRVIEVDVSVDHVTCQTNSPPLLDLGTDGPSSSIQGQGRGQGQAYPSSWGAARGGAGDGGLLDLLMLPDDIEEHVTCEPRLILQSEALHGVAEMEMVEVTTAAAADDDCGVGDGEKKVRDKLHQQHIVPAPLTSKTLVKAADVQAFMSAPGGSQSNNNSSQPPTLLPAAGESRGTSATRARADRDKSVEVAAGRHAAGEENNYADVIVHASADSRGHQAPSPSPFATPTHAPVTATAPHTGSPQPQSSLSKSAARQSSAVSSSLHTQVGLLHIAHVTELCILIGCRQNNTVNNESRNTNYCREN